jgi:hypothetical protein
VFAYALAVDWLKWIGLNGLVQMDWLKWVGSNGDLSEAGLKKSS